MYFNAYNIISSVIKSISIHHWMSSSSVVFNRISGDQAALQQFSYILANLLGLAMAMYKCHTMGLLPTSQSDWVEFMDQQQVLVSTMYWTIKCIYLDFGIFIWRNRFIMTSRTQYFCVLQFVHLHYFSLLLVLLLSLLFSGGLALLLSIW